MSSVVVGGTMQGAHHTTPPLPSPHVRAAGSLKRDREAGTLLTLPKHGCPFFLCDDARRGSSEGKRLVGVGWAPAGGWHVGGWRRGRDRQVAFCC